MSSTICWDEILVVKYLRTSAAGPQRRKTREQGSVLGRKRVGAVDLLNLVSVYVHSPPDASLVNKQGATGLSFGDFCFSMTEMFWCFDSSSSRTRCLILTIATSDNAVKRTARRREEVH
jgi:hypothetical protein